MLVKVEFKNGKIRELSEHIAYDEVHQRSMGFKVMDGQPITQQPVIAKKKEVEIKSPVAEVNTDKEVTAQVETESLISEVVEKIKKKPGRKPKQ